MATLTPPFSPAAVAVPDGLVDRYVEAGWKRVDPPRRGPGRPKKQVAEDEK